MYECAYMYICSYSSVLRSCGGLSGDLEEFGDVSNLIPRLLTSYLMTVLSPQTILFTTDDDILSKVAANDTAAQEDLQGYYDGCEETEECLLHRPSTADHSQLVRMCVCGSVYRNESANAHTHVTLHLYLCATTGQVPGICNHNT